MVQQQVGQVFAVFLPVVILLADSAVVHGLSVLENETVAGRLVDRLVCRHDGHLVGRPVYHLETRLDVYRLCNGYHDVYLYPCLCISLLLAFPALLPVSFSFSVTIPSVIAVM